MHLDLYQASLRIDRVTVGDEPIAIGRSSRCRVRLVDPRVSRFHAEIRLERDGRLLLVDDSLNGVRVNGLPIEGHRELRPDDRIQIGQYEIHLAAGSEGEEPTLAATDFLHRARVAELVSRVSS